MPIASSEITNMNCFMRLLLARVDYVPFLPCAGAAGLADFAAEVRGGNFYSAAHLVQSRSHSCAYAVLKFVLAYCRYPRACWLCFFFICIVEVVRRDNGASGVTQVARRFNISCVQDIADSIAHPIGWLNASEIVDYEDLDRQNRCKKLDLRHFTLGSITVLNFPQQSTIFAKVAGVTT